MTAPKHRNLQEVLDLRPCKQRATKLFSPGHPLREALLNEPDFLPRAEGLAKLEAYLRMLLVMRESR